MLDSKGVIHKGRTDLTEQKKEFALDTADRTLEDAMKGADMFLGLSKPGVLTKEMVKTMAPHPIIFCARKSGTRNLSKRGRGSKKRRDRRHGQKRLCKSDQ